MTQPDFPLSTGRPQLELRVPLWVLRGLTAQADAAGISTRALAGRILADAVRAQAFAGEPER